jgi:hypothetical protein
MPSTYSPNLRIELIANGEQSGTWGTTTNTNLGTLVEDAISGYVSVSITSANQALTALNGAADQSRNMVINLTTTTTANFNVYIPPADKVYIIRNASAYTATIFCSTVLGNTTAAGTGVAVPAGRETLLFADGTNVAFSIDHLSSLTLATDLAVADGGTGSSSLAVNNVLLGNGTSPLQAVAPGTSGNVLTSNGTTWVSGPVFITGMIMMWSGSIASIPSGWALCNGSGGTPDLRDRFIVGAGNTYAVNATGGSANAIVVSHTHTATVTDPGHTHDITYGGPAGSVPSRIQVTSGGTQTNSAPISPATTGVTVGISTEGSSGTNANLPPYFALAYIMKT